MASPAIDTRRLTKDQTAAPTPIAAGHETLIREAFDDIALLAGSLAAIHNLDEDLLWTLMKRLDRIRIRLLRNLQGGPARLEFEPEPVRPPRTHASVDEFLARNRGRMGE